MRLKSLEIQGFKSFPDKTRLEFDRGLTAVVGPNGSGKSNIGDAVRWVLGEQSSKTLRGAKMEDVIFSGTQARKSVGFAQVTLNIDNTARDLQVESDDVSVSRKLYRSGESEYMINGSQVRLRDVYELFMDTGLGRDGYSIIGQGRVAEIVSAKSGERREIFEEAAGISKFRYKKAEAERKLAAAEENLVRLRDILGELEGRVEPLRKQSENAKKFLDYSEKKKVLELSLWNMKLTDLKRTLEQLNEKILINQGEYEAIDAEISRIEEDIEGSYKSMQESSVRIEGLRSGILEAERLSGEIRSAIAVMENDIAHAGDMIEELQGQVDGSEDSFLQLEEKLRQNDEEAKRIDDEIRANEQETDSIKSEFDTLAEESDSISKDYERLNEELSKGYIKRSELTVSAAAARNSVAEMEEQLTKGSENETALESEIEDLAKQISDARESLEAIEDASLERNNKISGLNRLYTGKADKLNSKKKEHEDAVFAIKEKQQRIQLLEDMERSMEGFSFSVKEVLKASSQGRIGGIRGTIAQLIRVEDRFSLAIETALGAAMQNVVVENEDIAKRCIRLLQEKKAGRATFLPMTAVKGNTLTENGLQDEEGFIAIASDIVGTDEEYSGIIRSLLGRIVISEDIDTAAMLAKKRGYKFRIVTLDGQIINAGGSFTGGSAAKSAGVLSRKNEIERLTAEAEALSRKLKVISEEKDKLQAEADKFAADIENEKALLSEAASDKIMVEAEIRRLISVKDQSEERLEDTALQIVRLRERIDEQKKVISDSEEELTALTDSIAETEKRLSEGKGKRDDMQGKREELSERLSALKIRNAELLKDREANIAADATIRESKKNIRENRQEILDRIEQQKAVIEEKRQQIELKQAEITENSEKSKDFTDKIEQEQKLHSEFERKATELRSEQKSKSAEREKFSAEITRQQERCFSVQKDYDDIIAALWEQYQLTRSEAAEVAEPLENAMTAQRDLNEVKQKIRSLGSVNVAAIEEYEEVSERYKFMKEQIGDVEGSKKELNSLISDLTENMRRIFSESFAKINENFKAIFVELFGGGRAELILTNPEDVLESGIEIAVAPPGKVIKNLSLLSGGEQAFVAIAIYFAILKIKPAPFCILDEIEAALDDVNVSKYAAYLRNFTGTTQFILITHRRGTMEEADVLYGVTMQDKGISKLIKLDQNAFPDDAG